MKFFAILQRNIQNNFRREFVLYLTLLVTIPICIYILSHIGHGVAEQFILQLADTSIFNWVLTGTQMTPFENGVIKLMLMSLLFSILFIVDGLYTLLIKGYYNNLLTYNTIIFIVQCLLIFYGYMTLTYVITTIMPICYFVDIKKHNNNKFLYVLIIIMIMYITINMFDFVMNDFLHQYIDFVSLEKSQFFSNHDHNTFIIYSYSIFMSITFLICASLYCMSITIYWYLFCFYLLSDVKKYPIDTIDQYFPCPDRGFVMYESIKTVNSTRVKVYKLLNQGELIRTVISFILTGLCFISILTHVSWESAFIFLTVFPGLVEITVKLIRVSRIMYLLSHNTHKST